MRPRTTIAIVAVVIVVIVASGLVIATQTSQEPSAPPVPTGPPGPDTTGVPAGVTLQPAKGSVVDKADAVVDSQEITGPVVVTAPGVTISNSRISGTGDGVGVTVKGGGSLTITNSEVSAFETGIYGNDWHADRVDVNAMTGDGVKLGSNVTLQNSWIHDNKPAPGSHFDGAQMFTGVTDLAVVDNRILVDDKSTSAIFLAPDLGPSTNGPVRVERNWLAGGQYTMYCVDGSDGKYVVKNITVADNTFEPTAATGQPVNVNVPVDWRNNTIAGTGEIVEP